MLCKVKAAPAQSLVDTGCEGGESGSKPVPGFAARRVQGLRLSQWCWGRGESASQGGFDGGNCDARQDR